jgi:glycosyltransferase involved in cell wall biosynthesis
MALLNSKHSGFQLLMGGGDKRDGSFQKTKQQAELSEVSHQITFSGTIPNKDVPHWLQKGDIFINTTNYDNTPVSVLEAMACGLCIVSTNVGGLPFLLHDGKDALLVPPNDPAAMVAAIQRILTEPDLAISLSTNGRKLVEQFDWRKIYPLWEDLFKNI